MRKFTLLFFFAICGILVNAQTNILHEDFATLTDGGNTASTGTGAPSSTPLTSVTSNFSSSTNAYSAGGAVKLGTSSKAGSITSIPLDLSVNGGVFKVKLKVKGWASVEGKIVVTAGALKPDTLSYSSTMSNSFEEVEASFTGGVVNSTITIATTLKRAFVDEVTVYYGGSNLSNDATLSDLKVNGTTVGSFSPTTINYFVTLPSSTNTLPSVSAATTDANATASVVQATSYTDTAYVNVTAQNGTTTKQYSVYFSKEAAAGEKGSSTNPYTVAEAKAFLYPTGTNTKFWVQGYIIGSLTASGSPFGINTTDVDSNIGLADASTETNVNNILPVELPSGNVRTALNVVTTPANKTQLAKVYGNLILYFNVTGVKNTTDYQIAGQSGVNSSESGQVLILGENGQLVIKGLDSKTSVQIYSATGSLVKTILTSSAEISVPVSRGLYIVKVDSLASKVLVK